MSPSLERDPDRMVLFTDAVVAIAITLLVLPLVDVVSESVAEHLTSIEVVTEHRALILSFLLSFAVIARLWMIHHSMFEHVRTYTRPLMMWNLVWLLTIVLLPFPTEMVGAYSDDHFTTLFYIGNIAASSACLTVLTLIIARGKSAEQRHSVVAGVSTGLLVLAFVLTALVPAVTYYSMLLLLLTSPVTKLVRRVLPSTGSAS